MNRLGAALYDRVMENLEARRLGEWRRELLSPLSGRVLEIGAGTGRNLDWYPPAVTELVLTEPDPHMRERLQARARAAGIPLRVIGARAEELPFRDGHFNVVVSTLVLCSVRQPTRVAAELRRVLGEDGHLVVIEHVVAATASSASRWQALIEPVWRRVAGNCHLTRDTAATLGRAGFDTSGLRDEKLPEAPGVVRHMIHGQLGATG